MKTRALLVVLAVALVGAPLSAFAGPVGLCGDGRPCRTRSVTLTDTSTYNFYTGNLTYWSLGTGGCYGLFNSNVVTWGGSGCQVSLPGSVANPSYFQVTGSQGVNIGSAVLVTSFATPATVGTALLSDATTGSLWWSNALIYKDHTTPTFDGRRFVLGYLAATGAWAWDVGPRVSSTDLSAITETCNATGGEASLSNAAGSFGTFTRTGRSCSTSAVLNNVGLVRTPNAGGAGWTAGSNNRFRACAYAQISSVASVRVLWGQVPAATLAAPTDNPTAMGTWFRFSTAAGDTTWQLCSSDSASAATCTNTNVTVVAGSAHLLCLDKREGSAVVGWVDGKRVRKTDNLPLTGIGAALGWSVQTLAAAVRTMVVGPVTLEVF